MMIITRILFIYLVFYSSVSAKDSDSFFVTFEMMKGSSQYLDVMKNKIKQYEKRGLKCYIEDFNPTYSFRCNDTKTLKDYKESKALLNGLNLHYKVVPLHKKDLGITVASTKASTKKVAPKQADKMVTKRSLNLGDGYKLYNEGKYNAAKGIFSKLYAKSKNLDTAYAMALIAMKETNFLQAKALLDPYKNDKKANKLISDALVGQYYQYIQKHQNEKALALQNKYKGHYKALAKLQSAKHRLNLGDGYKAYNAKEYNKAKQIFTALYKSNPNLENSYAMALVALKEKNFPQMRRYLQKYRTKSKKVDKLYYDSIVSEYYTYLNNGENKKALALQKEYIAIYPKLSSLAKPKPALNLGDGYNAYNAKDYAKATSIFSKLYKENPNAQTAYAMSLLALKKQDFPLVRYYLKPYRKSDAKAAKLYYDSIVYQYQSLLGDKKDKEALDLLARYNKEYPKLDSLEKPNNGLNLGVGYKAYNEKNYDQARATFFKLYNKKHNLENAYAVGLILLHDGEYEKLRNIIKPYRTSSDKVSKLYYDSIVSQYYDLRKQGKKGEANELIKKYMILYPKLSKFNENLLLDANNYIDVGEYKKAQSYLKKNGYENADKYIFEKKYQKALQLRSQAKDFQAINLMMPYIKTEPKASQLYVDISMALAGLYLENKNYSRAKNLLEPIVGVSKKAKKMFDKVEFDENLALGWESYNKRKREKSLHYFEEACHIHKDTKCMEGIMNASFALKDYKRAYSTAVTVYDKTVSPDAALVAYTSSVKLGNKDESEFWYNLLSNKDKVTALYRIKAEDADKEYLNRLYENAIAVNKNDFDLITNYLYFLKDAKYNDRFEKVMKDALNYYTEDVQQHILHRIKREYQNSRLYEYYKTQQNEACFEYGNKILRSKDDISYKRMHAWCAYKSENYKSAERIFATINAKYGPTTDDVYGQFISAYNNKDYKKAKKLLAYLSVHAKNDKDRENVVNYYISMNELDKAHRASESIEDDALRERLQQKINSTYKYGRNEYNAVAGGLFYKKRSIADDLHSFEQVILPIDADLYTKHRGHYYLDLDIMSLTDTFTGTMDNYTLEQALGEEYDVDVETTNSVVMPTIGAQWKYLTLEFGATPLGATIDAEPLGKVSLHTANEDWNLKLNFVKTAVDDSMLSLVGDSRVSNDMQIEWGRITKTGVEVGFAYNDALTYSLDVGLYPYVTGENVVDNSEVKAVGAITYHVPTSNFAYLDYGILAVYDSYDVSSDSYTYGNGGYFSPQQFLLGNLVVELGDMNANDFYWKTKLSLGYESFSVDDSWKYPIEDYATDSLTDGQRSDVNDGYDENGLTYKVALGAGYKISKKLDIVAGFSLEEMKEFQLIEAGFSFVYSFSKVRKVNLYNFHSAHRVDDTLR